MQTHTHTRTHTHTHTCTHTYTHTHIHTYTHTHIHTTSKDLLQRMDGLREDLIQGFIEAAEAAGIVSQVEEAKAASDLGEMVAPEAAALLVEMD